MEILEIVIKTLSEMLKGKNLCGLKEPENKESIAEHVPSAKINSHET